jgi:hypothetical protein
MTKSGILAFAVCAALGVQAQSARRESFMEGQAMAEVQRVAGQLTLVQDNLDDLSSRLSKMEGGRNEIGQVRADVDSLRADLAALRREVAGLHGEIVKDLTKKLVDMQRKMAPAPAAPSKKASRAPSGDCQVYTVEKGDSLSLIAQAFATTVSELRRLNSLSSDTPAIGQKLYVPKKR